MSEAANILISMGADKASADALLAATVAGIEAGETFEVAFAAAPDRVLAKMRANRTAILDDVYARLQS